jgi:hypothetical protein
LESGSLVVRFLDPRLTEESMFSDIGRRFWYSWYDSLNYKVVFLSCIWGTWTTLLLHERKDHR